MCALCAILLSTSLLNDIKAQPCPTVTPEITSIAYSNCSMQVIISFTSTDWSSIANLEIEEFEVRFGLGLSSGAPIITSASFLNSGGEMASNGTDINVINAGSDVMISHNVTNPGQVPLEAIFCEGPQIILTIEGLTAGDFGQITRLLSPHYYDYVGGPTGCTVTTTDSWSYLIPSNEISGTISAVSGSFSSCSNQFIEGADVVVNPGFNEICSTTTDNNGDYSCTSCEDGPYMVCASAVCDNACSLTSHDRFILNRVIVFDPIYSDFYYQVAGDINRDGTVNNQDKLILTDELNNQPLTVAVNWCRFMPVDDYVLEVMTADNCSTTQPEVPSTFDFVRIAMGDMNGTCGDCIHGDNTGDFPIVMEDQGDQINFYVSNDVTLLGLDLELETDPYTSIDYSSIQVIEGINMDVSGSSIRLEYLDSSMEQLGLDVPKTTPLISVKKGKHNRIELSGNQNNAISIKTGVFGVEVIERPHTPRSSIPLTLNGQMISFDGNPNQKYSIELRDVSGRMIDTDHLMSSNLTLPNITAGIYLLSIRQDNAISTRKIFISQ